MALTYTGVRKAKAKGTAYRLSDGGGLYLWITPAGGKLWRWKYRHECKEKLMSFGKYPDVPLSLARERHAEARKLLASGVDPMVQRARGLIRQICAAREVTIVRGAVSPDHIHLLVAAPPQLAPAKLVQYLKGRSSRMLQEEFPHLRKRYWGQHLWARGYFCATVGAADEKTIQAYIENQKWDEDAESFKITASTEP